MASQSLKQDSNKSRLNSLIQRVILNVAEDDKINRPTDTPNSDHSSVCTPMQGIASIEQGFISCAESGNRSTRCVLTYDLPDQNSQIRPTWYMETKSKLKSIKFCSVDKVAYLLFIDKRTVRSK